jgi:hypothetical protein
MTTEPDDAAAAKEAAANARWRKTNLRHRARREGLQLVKLPKPIRGLPAPNTDKYLLVWPATGQVLSPTLDGQDEVTAWLDLDANARRKHMRKLVAAR